jgi:hypothetical protein
LGEQRKRMDGRSRLPSMQMTHSCQSTVNFAVVHNAQQ